MLDQDLSFIISEDDSIVSPHDSLHSLDHLNISFASADDDTNSIYDEVDPLDRSFAILKGFRYDLDVSDVGALNHDDVDHARNESALNTDLDFSRISLDHSNDRSLDINNRKDHSRI